MLPFSQTEAFHEEYAFQPIDKAFKGFFRVRVHSQATRSLYVTSA